MLMSTADSTPVHKPLLGRVLLATARASMPGCTPLPCDPAIDSRCLLAIASRCLLAIGSHGLLAIDSRWWQVYVLRQLRHRHIVRVMDVIDVVDATYIVME
jgi:hypothetical protein